MRRCWPLLAAAAVAGLALIALACDGGGGTPATETARPTGSPTAPAGRPDGGERTPDAAQRTPAAGDGAARPGGEGTAADGREVTDSEALSDRVPVGDGGGAGDSGTSRSGSRSAVAGAAGFLPVTPYLIGEADGVKATLTATADPYANPKGAPPSGTRFVGFRLTLESTSGGSAGRASSVGFKLVDSSGSARDGSLISAVGLGGFAAAELTIAFAVPTNASPKVLIYDPDPSAAGRIELRLP